jgi:uncharacterized protein with ParB-like and HNH nuclease domain
MSVPVGEDELRENEESRDWVADEAENDETVPVERYDITSFGADYDVEGLVKRLNRGDVFIPPFQRDYVWTQKEASKFVESLLLGLPVPGVFMAREAETNKLLVIDGQQRLKSLQFFFNGFFNPRPGDKTKRVFKLTKVQAQFEGLAYETLTEQARVKLNDAIIHATIVKQESPEGDDTSIYYIFERLNYGGRKLTPQEIRVAIYHGPLIDTLGELNEDPRWREVYGPPSARLKDQELILRFFAFFVRYDQYRRPMTEFVNKFAGAYRRAKTEVLGEWKDLFRTFADALGRRAFRPENAINAAVFDSMMVGMAKRAQYGTVTDIDGVRRAYEELLRNSQYNEAVSRSTADEKFVATRIDMATAAFADLE